MFVQTSVVVVVLLAPLALGCHSFINTTVTLFTKTGTQKQTVTLQCLERKTFENVTVVKIEIENQKVPKLEKDSIRHLIKLAAINFSDCQIEEIESDLFRNVPQLQTVTITRNRIRTIPRRVFTSLNQLQVLDLSRNRISQIQSGAFGNSTLKEVNLSRNILDEWSALWFDKSLEVEKIDFSHNEIKVLPRRAFLDLPKLKWIEFSYNELKIIHREVFAELSHLEYLGLKYNKLRVLNAYSFPNDLDIEKLSLGANLLNFLPKKLMANLQVKKISLFGNPWKCPCLHDIHAWLYENNAALEDPDFCTRQNLPVCAFPASFPYTCRDTEDDELTNFYLRTLKELQSGDEESCIILD